MADSGDGEAESGGAVSTERVGVLLLNLGGPDTLDDVQPFLFNLFADPVSNFVTSNVCKSHLLGVLNGLRGLKGLIRKINPKEAQELLTALA